MLSLLVFPWTGLEGRCWVPAAACAEAVVLYQLILASNTQRLELRDVKACKTLQLMILDTQRLNLPTAIPTVAESLCKWPRTGVHIHGA